MPLDITRRQFLIGGAACAGTLITPKLAQCILPPVKVDGCTRSISMRHIHTGEKFDLPYWKDGQYSKDMLKKLNHFMRDWRQNSTCEMNPELFDLMHKLAVDTGNPDGVFDIICGYRCPATNKQLRSKSKGVAKKSRHMTGDAIDLNLKGTKLKDQRDAARALKKGGVGYYGNSGFIHVDIRDRLAYW